MKNGLILATVMTGLYALSLQGAPGDMINESKGTLTGGGKELTAPTPSGMINAGGGSANSKSKAALIGRTSGAVATKPRRMMGGASTMTPMYIQAKDDIKQAKAKFREFKKETPNFTGNIDTISIQRLTPYSEGGREVAFADLINQCTTVPSASQSKCVTAIRNLVNATRAYFIALKPKKMPAIPEGSNEAGLSTISERAPSMPPIAE